MDVREIDARDERAFAPWHEVTTAVLADLRPDDVHPDAAEARASCLAGRPEHRPETSELLVPLLALDGDRPVGAARLELPLRDNQHLGWVEVHVLPAARRRGAGTALLQAAEQATRAAGRTLVMTELDEPPALAGASPGRAFLAARGYAEVLQEVRRDLALPVPAELLDALQAEAERHAGGYDVLTWRDRCPDDLVDERAALARAMSTEVPLGELDWREETWDAARVREREELVAAQGRSHVVAAARHRATGRLVAFTELSARPARPEQVAQWDTLVLPGHRGHRLGLLVKLAALRRLVDEVPGVRSVTTSNAVTNAPMIAVNEALGFVPSGTLSSWQRAV